MKEQKQVYARPELRRMGAITRLTLRLDGSSNDGQGGGGGGNKKSGDDNNPGN